MPRPKGIPKTGGRAKGTPNKLTGDLKRMILEAAEQADEGGTVGYLKRQANENPAPFMALLGKVLPLTVAAAGDAKGGFTLVIHESPKE